jgi:5-carboxymethyl-2-hydroxymuconate isomerase
VGPGRDPATRLAIGRALFDLMVERLQPLLAQQAVTLSFEMRELDEHVRFNQRNF